MLGQMQRWVQVASRGIQEYQSQDIWALSPQHCFLSHSMSQFVCLLFNRGLASSGTSVRRYELTCKTHRYRALQALPAAGSSPSTLTLWASSWKVSKWGSLESAVVMFCHMTAHNNKMKQVLIPYPQSSERWGFQRTNWPTELHPCLEFKKHRKQRLVICVS